MKFSASTEKSLKTVLCVNKKTTLCGFEQQKFGA